jgi:phosphoserine phosphatase
MRSLSDSPPPYGTIVFDCDSTLSRIEGIEELAHECRDQVSELTAQAMDGLLPLEQAYGARLDLISPMLSAVEAVGDLYLREALPNAAELVAALHALDKRVVIVSGGLLPAVRPFARALGIEAQDRVHAVDINFDSEGRYIGFDEASPLARSGGKISILRSISLAAGAGQVAFIGDGATDLEAAGEVARFIAFGGVVRRPAVFDAAKVTLELADLAGLVPLLFSSEELASLARLGQHAALLDTATALS